MIDRGFAAATAAAALALALAPLAFPAATFFHTEVYVAALALAGAVVAVYAYRAARGRDGVRGRRVWPAFAGVALIVATAFAAGLLGPDTQTVVQAPGTVAALPDLGLAAFFPLADASELARGHVAIVLRRRNAPEISLASGARRFAGAALLVNEPHLAAFVDVADRWGRHLTLTQPANPAFLSPVLFFAGTTALESKTFPSDAFAVPAAHRAVRAIYLSQSAARSLAFRHVTGDAVLFVVDNDRGEPVPGGIGLAPSGGSVIAGGLRLRATLGTYPRLIVASAPHPLALWLGGTCIALGLALGYGPGARSRTRPPAGAAAA